MKISTILQVLSIPAWLPQLPVLVSSELHMTIIPVAKLKLLPTGRLTPTKFGQSYTNILFITDFNVTDPSKNEDDPGDRHVAGFTPDPIHASITPVDYSIWST